MKPVLLDQRSLFKAGVTVSLVMLVVFFSGYYLGHQKATPGNSMELNKTIALALPRPAYADLAELDQQPPRVPEPGASIDVDSPDTVADGVDSLGEIVEASVAAGTADPANPQLPLASLAVTPAESSPGSETAAIEPAPQQRRGPDADRPGGGIGGPGKTPVISDTARVEDASYTIQVGVFADEQNALRRKSELEAMQLSAYITQYANKRDEPRFNVRFGYFKNKSSALTALQTFEHHMSGSGYVARIRPN